MDNFIFSVLTQCLTFIPLALGISLSFNILRATDMTMDGSFVLGAGLFAHCVTLGFSPYLAALIALMGGVGAGLLTAYIQRGGRVDSLLAGILATFILSSLNLIIMGRPNISLLSQPTLVSGLFAQSQLMGWLGVTFYTFLICGLAYFILQSKLGLTLRAFGDNPNLLKRLGKNIEFYRMCGFALTNLLAASAGCLTAQTIGYADIGMGLGMTLTGIGAIILGQQIMQRFLYKKNYFRVGSETLACLCGIIVYFFSVNVLVRFNVDPIYLKMLLGLVLIFFLRSASVKIAGGQ